MSSELPEQTHTVELAVADTHGILRGKRIPATRWPQASEDGIAMANIVFSWTPRCEIREDDTWVTPSDGWPDMHLLPIPDTLRAVPWRPGAAMVLCDPCTEGGDPVAVSPRAVLRRVLDRAAELGFEVRIGFEIEFYLLDAATRMPREDDIQCYGIARGSAYEPVLAPMRNQLCDFGIPIEASNVEYAPGQIEVNIRYDEALRTADNAVLFRNAVREIAAQHGFLASFMAKIWHEQSGSGMHLHQSLWADGRNVFADNGQLSETGRHYLGGLQRHMPDLTLLGSPTPNALKRREPYTFCPTNNTWGIDNRTTALRVVPGRESAVRIEQRDGSADCNPYLAMAAQIAAGLDGIEQSLEPSPVCSGDAYADETASALPTTIPEAADMLEHSALATRVFGKQLIDNLVAGARHEHHYVHSRVSDVERERYLDVF